MINAKVYGRKLFSICKLLMMTPFNFLKNREKRYFQNHLGSFTSLKPDDQNSIDLFNTLWSTSIPDTHGTGSFNGFNDERIRWLLEQLGNVEGEKILELGPLEGGHTYMLEHAGAKVTSVEGNYGAFLRCLTVKNLLGLESKFLLGDFSKMEMGSTTYNTVVASGVLYHLADPISLLEALSKNTDNIFLWTHYFEEDLKKWSPLARGQLREGKWDIKSPRTQEFKGLEVRSIRQKYGKALGWRGFCGGTEAFSYWIYKKDLLTLLTKLGFRNIRINFDKVDHPNGPCFALIASKFDVAYYLDPNNNPDLHHAFGQLPSDEQEVKAIEHFNVFGRKEGRLAIAPRESGLSVT